MERYLQDRSSQTWLIASVSFAAFISSLDGSIVAIALPDIAAKLHVPVAAAAQVIVAYLLFMTASLPLVGLATKTAYGEDLLAAAGVDHRAYTKFIGERPAAQKILADRKAAQAQAQA